VGSEVVRDGVVLAVRDLRVHYPGATIDALAGVSLDLRAGELVGLTGLNGAGKTTLCRCLNGIVPQLVAAEVRGFATRWRRPCAGWLRWWGWSSTSRRRS
jgi:ABC-type multidrug transport system ATPase subunit